MAGHAQLKFIIMEGLKTQIRLIVRRNSQNLYVVFMIMIMFNLYMAVQIMNV